MSLPVTPQDFRKKKQADDPLHETRALTIKDGEFVGQSGVAQDITEPKRAGPPRRAEAARRHTERRFRSLSEHSTDAIALFGADGAMLYASPSTTAVMGYDPEEILQRNMLEFVRPDWQDKVREKIAEVLRCPGVGIPTEAYVRNKDGEYRFLEGTFTNLLDEPSVGAIVNNYRDVTERKQAEVALRESEDRYQDLVENSNDLVYTHDMDGIVLFANQTCEKILGYLPSEAVGKKLTDFLAPEVGYLLDDYFTQIRTHGVASGIMTNLTKSGEKRVCEYYNTLRADGAQGPVVRCIAHDVTESKRAEEDLRRSEQRFAAFMNNTCVQSWMKDSDFRYVYGNEPFSQLLGRNLADIVGKTDFDLLPEETALQFRAHDEEVFASGTMLETQETIRDKEGVVRHSQVFRFPYRAAGKPYVGGMAIDITERREAEAALRQAEEQYRTIFENAVEGMFQTTADGEFIAANPAMARMLGFDSPEELIADHSAGAKPDCLDPQRREEFKRLLDEQGSVRGFEYQGRRKDGSNLWLSDSVRAVRDESGTLLYYEGIAENITERKQADEKLRESEEKYRTILERMQEGYAEVDLRGTYVFVNDSFCRITGRSHSELVGANYKEFFDPEQCQLLYDTYHHVYLTGEPVDGFEYVVTRKDGTKRLVEESVILKRDAEGLPIGFTGIRRDVTERKRAEEALRESENRLHTIVEGTQALLVSVDADGHFTYANDAAARAVGYASPEELIGKSYIHFVYPEDRPRALDTFINQANTRQPSSVLEFRIIAADGSVKWFSFLSTLTIKDGEFVGQSGVAQDITERKQAEAALRGSEEKLTLAMRAANMGSWVLNMDTLKFEADAVAKVMHGFTADEPVSEIYQSLTHVHPEDISDTRRRFKQAFQTRGSFEGEYRVVLSDGSTRWISSQGSVDKNTPCLMGMVQDITERKQAEAALRESEARLRLSVEAAAVGLWDWNLVTNDVFFSPEWKQQLGHTNEDLPNRYEEWESRLHPEDRGTTLAAVMDFRERRREDYDVEFRLRHKDGSWRWIYTHGDVLRDADGKPVRMLGCHIDITERKRAEEALQKSELRFRSLVTQSPIGIYETEPSGGCIFVNQRWAQISGLPPEKARGDGWAQAIHPKDRASVFAEWNKTASSGDPFDLQYRFLTPQGVATWVHGLASPVRNESGEIVSYFGTISDITERKQAEAEITELLTREQQACQEAEVMRDANVALTQNLSIESVLNTLLAHLGKLIPYDSANVMLRESETKLVVSELFGYEGFQDGAITRAITLDVNENALLRQICTTGMALLISDTNEEPAWQELIGAGHVRCWLGVPLIAYGKVIGLFSVNHEEPGLFTAQHVRIAQTLAAQAASAINNAQLFEQGQRYAAELEQRIAERERAEEDLRISGEQLRALAVRLQTAREEEGTHIAREIHDELGGVLTSLKWDLEECEKVLSASTNGESIASIRKKIPVMTGLLDTTIDTVRRISSELRPGVLDDLGLVAAIEWQSRQFQQRTGIECRRKAGLATIDLNRDQATAVFRVVQEVLTNVTRHAQATRVEIKMSEAKGEFVLEVKDNGRGISESERQNTRALGLLGMRERMQLIGGTIDISGAKGKGTRVVVRVPLG